jgi:hypothetical protein
MVVAIMAGAIAVSVVYESDGAVENSAAGMPNRNPIYDEYATSL